MRTIPVLRITRIILFILLSSTFFYIESSYANDIFKNLSINDGLSHTDAKCVAQDSTGLIWIGTNSGLQNFNGYRLQSIDYYPFGQKIYESHNRINAMECSKNRLWIGSDSGLTCLDLNTHLYIPFTIVANDHTVLKERILYLTIDTTHNLLWVRTQNRLCVARIEESTNTLYILDWENDYDREILWSSLKPIAYQGSAWMLAGEYLVQLGIDDNKVKILANYNLHDATGAKTYFKWIFGNDEFLYLRSSQGCYRIPFTNSHLNVDEISYVDFYKIAPYISENTYGPFIVERDGTLWCSYFGGLLEISHPFSTDAAVHVYLGNSKNVNFSRSTVMSLFVDTYDNLWVSMIDKGLYYCSLSPTPFRYIPRQALLEDIGLLKGDITAVIAQDDAVLWMIVEGGNLFRYDKAKGKAERMSLSVTQGAVDGLQTLALSSDQKRLYIGLARGLIVYEIDTRKSYWLIGKGSKMLSALVSVAKMAEDHWGRLWVCAWEYGIYCIDQLHTDHPRIVFHLNTRTKQAVASNYISDLYMEQNAILLCTTRGLNKIWMNEDGGIRCISTYQVDNNLAHSMSSDYLACIDKQNDSIYWVGTIGGGLDKITIHSEKDNDYSAVVYTQDDGLTNNDCEIVYLDNEQNVWIGGNGITCFTPETMKIAIYEQADGLQTNSFKIGAGYKSSGGTIYMGGIGGMNFFDPQDFVNNPRPISLNFCNLYVNNQIVIPQKKYEGKVILPVILNNVRHVSLMHDQNNFIISFSVFGCNLSNRVMYRYRMIGYDKNWQVVSYSTDRAYYSNLPYGNYKFELQVSTDRGFSWQKPGKTLELSVLPPWWLTIWAKLSYIVISVLIILFIAYQYSKEQRLKRENHIQELQRINDEERYQSKMRFFMNVSHELKTPLTLIMLAAERMAEFNLSKECMAILANARRMLSLITELVDIRKADLGINQLSLSSQNMSELVNQLYIEMSPWAEKKNITIEYKPEGEDIIMDLDRDKIGKLVINLISNALKYTPMGGTIRLALRKGMMQDIVPLYSVMHREGEVRSEQPVCILTVQDTGVGISPESIKYIYERFFQVKDINLTHLGSGIGLAIAKNMVLLHKGCLIVSSERSVGTEFIVALPVANEVNAQEPAVSSSLFDMKEFIESQYVEYAFSEDVHEESLSEQPLEDGLPTLLIVEDNKELQKALRGQLSSFYNIKIADNGRIGLEMCESLYPDIIVSDVMMPEMDGIEMCKRIRDNLAVAYIPIILLTAKGEVNNQIEGYESGADLYIPKPFSMKLLEVNIKRLLAQKERWLKLERPTLVDKEELSEDDKSVFEKRFKQLVEDNMGNPDFSIDFLCRELGMGRTKLYSKMKEFSERPLADYIRSARLEKAVYLLEYSDMNVNEIAFEVGFINNSHFARTFKAKYGVSPSDYKKQQINN